MANGTACIITGGADSFQQRSQDSTTCSVRPTPRPRHRFRLPRRPFVAAVDKLAGFWAPDVGLAERGAGCSIPPFAFLFGTCQLSAVRSVRSVELSKSNVVGLDRWWMDGGLCFEYLRIHPKHSPPS